MSKTLIRLVLIGVGLILLGLAFVIFGGKPATPTSSPTPGIYIQ